MDLTQIGLGIVLVAIGATAMVGPSVLDSDVGLLLLTAGAVLVGGLTLLVWTVHENRTWA